MRTHRLAARWNALIGDCCSSGGDRIRTERAASVDRIIATASAHTARVEFNPPRQVMAMQRAYARELAFELAA